jgi:phosphoribosyl 1,2-cyclic phosphate phosphodiesterase
MRVECEMLGTGTSYGVPSLGCNCHICTSTNPKNKRLRASVLFRVTPGDGRERRLLVDVTPDFRQQALRAEFAQVDAVLMTHEHADHTQGFDDLRACYYAAGKHDLPLFAYPETMAALRHRFEYMFDREYEYKGVARFEEHLFEDHPFSAAGVEVTPVPLVHGAMRVAAFRIGDLAYITDCNRIPPTSIAKLRGCKAIVMDALRRSPHPTHMSLPESIEACREIGVERAWFTHINHDMDHEEVCGSLPKGYALAHDTLRIVVEDGKVSVAGDRLGR